MRWSEARCLSQIVLSHALRQASVSLIFDVRQKFMPIYKLSPIENGSADWQRSAYKGEVVIRAHSEKDARAIASVSFGIAKQVTPGEKTTFGPWRDRSSVHCEEIADSNFDAAGPRTVIRPAEWATEITFAPAQ